MRRCCCENAGLCDQYHSCVVSNGYPSPQIIQVSQTGNRPYRCCGISSPLVNVMNKFAVTVNQVSVVGAKYIEQSSLFTLGGHVGRTWLVLTEIDYTLSFQCSSDDIPDECEQLSGNGKAYTVIRFGCGDPLPDNVRCTAAWPNQPGDAFYNNPAISPYNAQTIHTNGQATEPTGNEKAIECRDILDPNYFFASCSFAPVSWTGGPPTGPNPCPDIRGYIETNSGQGREVAFGETINTFNIPGRPCQKFTPNLFTVPLVCQLGGGFIPTDCSCGSGTVMSGTYPNWSPICILETEWSMM